MVEPLVANETVVSSNLITRSIFSVLAVPSSNRHRIFWVIFLSAASISTIAALRPAPPEPIFGGHDKLAHGLVFLFLSMLLDTARGDFDARTVILLTIGGVVVESLQLLQPTRQFSLLDIAANCAGITLYWAGRSWLFRLRDA